MTMQRANAGRRTTTVAGMLFPTTIVLGSFLLFLMQPMIARMALPRLGGAPAVWNSAMLVYQALLLGGYAYAHLLVRASKRVQPMVHIGMFLCAALWLPIGIGGATLPIGTDPILWTPWFIGASIGPLFLIVASQAPLLQSWYASDERNGDPYPLYAASNAGSFAGLLSYPLIMEPIFGLEQQRLLWSAGFCLLAVLTLACGAMLRKPSIVHSRTIASRAPGARRVMTWMLLTAVPSGLMLSTTSYLTTDIVAVPLIWVLPLAIYLLSFIVAFSTRQAPAAAVTRCAHLVLLVGGGFILTNGARTPLVSVAVGLLMLYVAATAMHAELNRRRPDSDRLTSFYLSMSAGGVIGGAFCALLAPAIFDWVYEHPVLILAAAGIIPMTALSTSPSLDVRGQWSAAMVAVAVAITTRYLTTTVTVGISAAVIAVIGFVLVLRGGLRGPFVVVLASLMLASGGWYQIGDADSVLRTRTYFGSYRVIDDGDARIFLHGTTAHGEQRMLVAPQTTPISYYSRTSGVGRVMEVVPAVYGDHAKVAVVGLGVGVMACHRKQHQSWHFYEIDQKIVDIARDADLFTYMSTCAPGSPVTVGDARLTIGRDAGKGYDVLVLDAFSSDAVPVHLLTSQALTVYEEAMSGNGVIVAHISNQHLNLLPTVAATAGAAGMKTIFLADDGRSSGDRLVKASRWVVMSRSGRALRAIMETDTRWIERHADPDVSPWTDDHASILPALLGNWRGDETKR